MSNNAHYCDLQCSLFDLHWKHQERFTGKDQTKRDKVVACGGGGCGEQGVKGEICKGQRRRGAELARPSRGLFAGLQGLGRANYEVLWEKVCTDSVM